jgi:(E)-4-hydroxy-3-methylbut-2-enyl-diphosphate synthase
MPDHKISQENLVDQLESEIRAKAAAKEVEMAVMAEQIIVKG